MGNQKLRRVLSGLCTAALMAAALPLGSVLAEEGTTMQTANLGWDEIQSILSQYTAEWTEPTYEGLITDRVPHTALLGNGDVGIASGGDAYSKNFYISKSDFWGYNDRPKAIGGVILKSAEEPQQEPVSLAQGKKVTASSNHPEFPPDRAVSGQWTDGYEGWVSNVGNPQWMEIDLGQDTAFDRIVIRHDEAARSDKTNNTMAFSVKARSDEGEEWTTLYEISDNHNAVTDVTLETPVTARYVRLEIEKATQETTEDSKKNPRARIGQFELYNTADALIQDAVSLALNKPVTASSHDGPFPPERVVSGRWTDTYEGWVSNLGNPQHIEIDLEEDTTFDRMVIRHKGADGDPYNTRAFSVSVRSDSAAEWEVIFETEDNTAGKTDLSFEEPITARYVRVDVTQGTQETTPDTTNYPRARISQIEIFDTSRLTGGEEGEDGPAPTGTFLEQQDILNARILTDMELDGVPVHMDTRMMANDNLLVTALTSKGDTPVELIAQVWAKADSASIPTTGSVTDNRATVTRTMRGANSGDVNSYNTQAALTAQIIGAEVTGTESTSSTADLAFTLPAGETVYIVTAIGGGGRTYNYLNELQGVAPVDQAAALLDMAQADGALEELTAEHTAWWKDYWSASAVWLDTTDERLQTIQKYYYGAQYELGCTIREGKVAPGLYGIWHTTDNPSWKSDYHLNYNFISTFYGSATANRVEQLLPAVEAITGYVENGQSDMAALQRFAGNNAAVQEFVNAKIADGSIDGEKGIEGGVLFPVGIGPWGMTLDASYHNQTFNAPFSAYPLIQYYEYTQDEEFLQDVLYEYLKPILTFLEAWVVKNDEGHYDIYAGANEGSWALNSVGELSTYSMCLRYAIMASEKLGVDADRREVWQDLLDNLAPYTVTENNGRTVFAMAQDSYSNGEWRGQPQEPNRLTMEPVFPALEFGYYSEPEILEIWYNTMQVLDEQNTWPGINCFPELYTQALMVRYDTETVVDEFSANIQRLIQTNLTIDDTTHGIEKAGATETVHQMLLTEDEGVVKVFPSWLTDKDAAFTNLRAPGAFLLTSSYSGEKQEVDTLAITSLAGNSLTIASPWADAVITDSTGKVIEAIASTAPNHPEELTYTFDTQVGETYTITKGEKAQTTDKTALQQQYEKMQSQSWSTEAFTAESLTAYGQAMSTAQAVLQNDDATQGQIDGALAALQRAVPGLEPVTQVVARFSAAQTTYSIQNTADSSRALNTGWKNVDDGPIDMTKYKMEDLSLQVRFTLEKSGTTLSDGSLFNTGVIKLRSVDDGGENNVGWSLGSRGFTVGENFLSIRLTDSLASSTGNMDWSCMDRLNMYIDSVNGKEGNFSMTISDAVIVDTSAANAKKTLLELWNTSVDETAYTPQSVAAYRQALKQAEDVLNDAGANLSAVELAQENLQTALDSLTEKPALLFGDVDGSGEITASDALVALQAATGKLTLEDAQETAANVDGEGDVTSADALMILQFSTRKITSFPVNN